MKKVSQKQNIKIHFFASFYLFFGNSTSCTLCTIRQSSSSDNFAIKNKFIFVHFLLHRISLCNIYVHANYTGSQSVRHLWQVAVVMQTRKLWRHPHWIRADLTSTLVHLMDVGLYLRGSAQLLTFPAKIV